MILKFKVEDVYERQDNMTAVNPDFCNDNNNNYLLDVASSITHTRQVGTRVHSCIIQRY